MELTFRVLGPLSIERNGRPVRSLSAKPRTLLAMLLMRANRVVSTDAIVDGLWDADPPATATGIVQTYVSQLRKVLEPGRVDGSPWRVVERIEPGYRLNVASGSLDADEFQILLDTGIDALRSGHPDVGAATLRRAADLWRGPALGDVRSSASVGAEAQRLDELRLFGLEHRIDADLALGRHTAIVAELEQLVIEHELRERFWGQLMTALYRNGRQADALAAYQRVRQLLLDDLGLDPSPALVQLQHDILSHAPSMMTGPADESHTSHHASSPRTEATSNVPRTSTGEMFYGRESELVQLREWWHQPGDQARVAVLVGESGIGKTRLAAAFAHGVEAEGGVVCVGRAVESGSSEYEPVLGALRDYVASGSDSLIGSWSVSSAFALSLLVPDVVDRRPDVASAADRWGRVDRASVLAAITGCFTTRSAGPLLFFLDDVQWADSTAMNLLSKLLHDTNIRVLATLRRPGGPLRTPFDDVLVDVRRAGVPALRITLGGLRLEDVQAAVASSVGGAMSEHALDFASMLHRRTKGHPFFVREYLLDVGNRRSYDPSIITDVELGLPEGVHDVVDQRLSRLEPLTVDLLRAAAVVGPDFDLAVIAEVVSMPITAALSAIEEAVAAGVIIEDGHRVDRYSFHHAITMEVLLARMLSSRRARLEWSIGEALERHAPADDHEHIAAIAHHFHRGLSVGDPKRVQTACVRAGDAEMARLAYDNAARFFEMAADAQQESNIDDAERADVLLALGRAADRAGNRHRCRSACLEAAHIARAADDPVRLARAAIGLHGSLGPGADPEVITLMTEAINALSDRRPDVHPDLLVELLVRLSRFLVLVDPATSRRLADEALRVDPTSIDPSIFALALLGSTLDGTLPRPTMAQRLAEAEASAKRGDDIDIRLSVLARSASAALEWGDRDLFDRAHTDFVDASGRLLSPKARVSAMIDQAGVDALDGHYADAMARLANARAESANLDDPNITDIIHMAELAIATQIGGISALIDRYRADDGGPPALHANDGGLWLDVYTAYILGLSGQHDAARPDYHRAMKGLPALLVGFTRRRNLAMLAEVARELRDVDGVTRLEPLLQAERPVGVSIVLAGHAYLGSIDRYLGLLASTKGDIDTAITRHRGALECHQQVRAPGWVARSRFDLASALLVRHDRHDDDEAAALLKSARADARRMGMNALTEELDTPGRGSRR